MKHLRCKTAVLLVATAVVLLLCVDLSAQAAKPISLKGLTDALKIGGLSKGELVTLIKERGVDFELTSAGEAELKSAGANAEILAAVRSNYRSEPVASTAPPATMVAPPEAAPPAPVAQKSPSITTIRDVKKLFIEKMSNNLDTLIKSEISRQMPTRLIVVLKREEAEAIMKGTATNRDATVTITDVHGTVQLWTGEANDKNLSFTLHGGQKEIAKKLVSDLKHSME